VARVDKQTLIREKLFVLHEGLSFSYSQKMALREISQVSSHIEMGKVEITYSHNALKRVSDVLIRLKEMPSFRDIEILF
jgi:hypothetical protein